jgi:hypothetical protein
MYMHRPALTRAMRSSQNESTKASAVTRPSWMGRCRKSILAFGISA